MLSGEQRALPAQASPQPQPVVVLDGLTKVYGSIRAVDGITLTIPAGAVFGLLGPNGAGKTTALEILVGLRAPTAGSARVLGLDPITDRARLVHHIGMQPQEASLFPNLRVVETLRLFASFHDDPLQPATVLEMVGLAAKQQEFVKRLSGGQRQRLLLGVALVANPRLLVLDEPTGSLDPQARRQLWDVIQQQRRCGSTVVLSTHSMEEAQALCDQVAIIDHGRIIALGAPSALIRQHFPAQTVVFETHGEPAAAHLQKLPGVQDVTVQPTGHLYNVRLRSTEPEATLRALFSNTGIPAPQGIRMEQATLEDVFLALTGRSIRENTDQAGHSSQVAHQEE